MDPSSLSSLHGPSGTAIVQVRDLCRTVGRIHLVENVTVSIRRGEILAITGPSGAGKSSFLRLINRLDEPTSGSVQIGGQDYREIDAPVLRRRVGMVMQSANLFPGTVKDNILFGPAQHHGLVSPDTLDELLAHVGLDGYSDRAVENLSGGEAQRVSFARTLANRPDVLLLDEPTAALDEESARGIERLVLDLASTGGMACLIVTHNMEQAARIAPRTMFMENGRTKSVGPTSEVANAIKPI